MLFYLLNPAFSSCNICQFQLVGHRLDHGDFFADGINQGKVAFREKDGQRDAWEATPGTNIQKRGSRQEPDNFCNGQRMEHVSDIQFIDVFSGDDVDFCIPVTVQSFQCVKLTDLKRC